jgi:hypothetical protein
MKAEVSLSYSEEPATGPYPKSYESSSHPHSTSVRSISIRAFPLLQDLPRSIFTSGVPT